LVEKEKMEMEMNECGFGIGVIRGAEKGFGVDLLGECGVRCGTAE
jgi:hypothetical protein